MTFKEHCAESTKLFGLAYEEVHRWLDEFMNSQEYGMRHRKKRHHEAGIRQVITLFGELSGPVARQHIISDLKQEGWTEQDPFPKDEDDFVKIGFF
ncbi:MAG: hypothetical protein HQK58_00425 [Deltaproteobacteria bacterium]|nr:hypothetical protein [Deltaproteobacteria bacterium]